MSKTAKSKQELIESIKAERDLLAKKFESLSPEQIAWPGSMDNWSVKDILAHLADWEQRFIGWHQAGLRGEMPEIPAPGMTWRDLPKLNQLIYEKYQHEPLAEVLQLYRNSHLEMLGLIESMTEAEIFEAGNYSWTGKTPLLNWIAANTSEHYAWARRNIRTRVILKGCPN